MTTIRDVAGFGFDAGLNAEWRLLWMSMRAMLKGFLAGLRIKMFGGEPPEDFALTNRPTDVVMVTGIEDASVSDMRPASHRCSGSVGRSVREGESGGASCL